MNFGFTEEQEQLRAEVRRFLDQSCPLEEVRKLADTPEGFSRELWGRVAELGWPGLTIPEAHGGVELGFEDLVVVLEETGRSLFPSPLISTTLAAGLIGELGSPDQRARWLPAVADGSEIGTLALLEDDDVWGPEGIRLRAEPDGEDLLLSGEKLFVPDAPRASFFLVPFRSGPGSDSIGVAIVERDAEGARVERLPCIDATRSLGRLSLRDARVSRAALLGEPGRAWPAVARTLDRGACAVTAEMVGAAEAALDLTLRYAKDRVQFGRPIGRFQGVKHPLAEMYVDIECWKSLVYYAAWAIDGGAEDAPLAVSRAKAYASEAFARLSVDVVQLHGGIGYTMEYDAQLFLKRAKWARPAFGDADTHYERVAALGGL